MILPRRQHARRTQPGGIASRGFTLLEMMVVVVIIGIVVTGALLSLGSTGRDSELERERDRLVSLVDYVRERAALQTIEYGLRCQQDGYQFVQYDARKSQWVEDPLDETLRARVLPAGLTLRLEVERRPIVLSAHAGQRAKGTALQQQLTPQVMLYSSGDLGDFRLTLTRPPGGLATVISPAADGTVTAGELFEAKP